MNTYHNMNIIVQTTGGDASPLNGKSEIPNKTLSNITISLLLNSIQKKDFFALLISMIYGFTVKLIIYCVAMLFTYSGMEQDLHTNTSKYLV